MAQQTINIGSTANDGSGTDARAAGTLINANFTELYEAINALGTASVQDVGAFATAAQGVKADTAVQPASLSTVATTGAYTDLSGLPTLGSLAALSAVTVSLITATGTPNSTTFLRGDGVWASPAGGGGGDLLAANNLSDLDSIPTARTNLGLGTAALESTSAFATAAQGALADSAIQAEDLGTAAFTSASDYAAASHVTATDNPHSVTKSQVGLANVDNTSDSAKPISTATQTALDAKANTSHSHAISDVTNLQTSLDGKAAATHSHAISDVTGLQTALDAKVGTDGDILMDVVITAAAYAALDPKVATTRYNIVG